MIDVGKLHIGLDVDSGPLSKLGDGLASVAKGAGVVVTAASGAVAAITGASISAYSELEQLQGGAEKIFGDASDTIVANADKAAASIGLTSQEYLDQALNMGSAMVKSLGGDQAKAAEYTDKAMKQMADNASVFGTDMEQVQNAYKGFAKENYTMLDNLKLGKPNCSV